jgi:hypothetical protein
MNGRKAKRVSFPTFCHQAEARSKAPWSNTSLHAHTEGP